MNAFDKHKIRGAVYGHLIADAVGTSYEFKHASNIPPFEQIEMIPPAGYKKSWSAYPPGIWSDDGSQMLCLLEYYLEDKDGAWYDRWAYKLGQWGNGHLWVNQHSFDSGMQTQEALQNLRRGVEPLKAGRYAPEANGNGSLMRTLPVALMNKDMETKAFFLECENISHITHPHERSKMACVLYCEVARELMKGAELNNAIAWADTKIRQLYTGKLLEEYEVVWGGQFDEPEGSGYVVNALWSAIYSIRSTKSYEDCVKRAIELGNDTDTTACIAGGLAGLIYGYEGIPQRWLDQLQEKETVEALLDRVNAKD
jgi:ADP-ribosylglycohydrolase